MDANTAKARLIQLMNEARARGDVVAVQPVLAATGMFRLTSVDVDGSFLRLGYVDDPSIPQPNCADWPGAKRDPEVFRCEIGTEVGDWIRLRRGVFDFEAEGKMGRIVRIPAARLVAHSRAA